jgi:hypothetical protein
VSQIGLSLAFCLKNAADREVKQIQNRLNMAADPENPEFCQQPLGGFGGAESGE